MNNVILELHQIRKSFGSVNVLDAVDFSLNKGEVHCLVGENGAGKSTLCKIIAGVLSCDSGQIRYKGEIITPNSVLEAQSLGIGLVCQEIMLVPKLTVLENMFLGTEIVYGPFAQMNWGLMRKRATEALERLEINIRPDAKVINLAANSCIF